MRFRGGRLWLGLLGLLWVSMGFGQSRAYFGFDKNEYPGDNLLPGLHRSFAYTGYWLNNPPGAGNNLWTGKRAILKANGFGFMILYNGRVDAELKGKDAAELGRSDAVAAASTAMREGFAPGAILFLDQEEGGRLLPEQSAYLFAWVEAIRGSAYRPGVYCSGILVPDGKSRISTAADILSHEGKKPLALWVANDGCPPAPGCVIPKRAVAASSGVKEAMVWQYAQSPRREFARQCASTYAADGNCYAPGLPHTFLDLNVSASADPSSGR